MPHVSPRSSCRVRCPRSEAEKRPGSARPRSARSDRLPRICPVATPTRSLHPSADEFSRRGQHVLLFAAGAADLLPHPDRGAIACLLAERDGELSTGAGGVGGTVCAAVAVDVSQHIPWRCDVRGDRGTACGMWEVCLQRPPRRRRAGLGCRRGSRPQEGQEQLRTPAWIARCLRYRPTLRAALMCTSSCCSQPLRAVSMPRVTSWRSRGASCGRLYNSPNARAPPDVPAQGRCRPASRWPSVRSRRRCSRGRPCCDRNAPAGPASVRGGR